MSENLFEKFKNVKAIAMDVDGVLTDGSLLCTDSGEWVRKMNIKDGYAISAAVKSGMHICVISGSIGEGVKLRMKRLGLEFVYQDVQDKSVVLFEWLAAIDLTPSDVLYIGDDIPDIAAMRLVAVACCPSDACEEVKQTAHYVSPFSGGHGCVRDIIEKVMKLQGTW